MADDDLEYFPLPEGYGAEPTARIAIRPGMGDLAATDAYSPDAFDVAASKVQRRYAAPQRAVLPAGPNDVMDTLRSIPRGIMGGLADTAAAGGQAAAIEMGDDRPQPTGEEGLNLLEQNVTGALPQPVTEGGRVGASIGHVAGNPANWVAPGLLRTLGYNVASGITSELGRKLYEGTPNERVAQLLGGFGPGVAERASALYKFLPQGSVGAIGGRLPQPTMDVPMRPGMGGLAAPPKLAPRNINKFTSGEAVRVANPGVYQRPDVIAAQGAANVAPEHPALHALFNVHRDDLYDIGQQGRRQGNVDPAPLIWEPSKPTPNNYAAEAIMNPRNAQRMVDTMAEAEKYPQLTRGMDAWYVMDPAYQRMVQLVGPEQAKRDYLRFNAIVPPFSAGSNVLTEINRGTAANMFAARGDYPSFVRYGGVKEKARATMPGYPMEDLGDVKGHAYHGAQADPITRYLNTGTHGFAQDTVKVPLYSLASGVPETGFQTRLPVPDAHFARASGMADVRKSKDFNIHMAGSEYRQYGPWYRENVAKPLGLEAVPAQGRMWGVYAPQTGVDTPVGAPKLELLAQSIWERAQRLGIDPYKLRDDVLTGKGHAMLPFAAIPAGAAAMGGLAQQDNYQ